MKKDFSSEKKKKKDLQQLSLVHIEVQEYIQHLTTINKDTYLLDTILDMHKEFYSKDEMKYVLKDKT